MGAEELIEECEDLEKLMDKLPDHGKTTDKQNKQIQKSIRDIMQDLAHDPNLDPHNIDYDELRKEGISEHAIEELKKLEHIYDEVDQGKHADISHIKSELESVIDEIEHEAHKKEDIQKHMEVIERDLQGDKPLTKAQKTEIKDELEHIIQDICSDKNIHVKDLTDKKLKSMGLTQEEIDKIKSLRDIYNDVNTNKPIDKEKLLDKVHHAEEDLGISQKSSR